MTRHLVLAAAAAITFGAVSAAPASAGPYHPGYKVKHWQGCDPRVCTPPWAVGHRPYRPLHGYGYAPLGFGIGMAGFAAPTCYVVRRRAYDGYGNVYVRRIRVCE